MGLIRDCGAWVLIDCHVRPIIAILVQGRNAGRNGVEQVIGSNDGHGNNSR